MVRADCSDDQIAAVILDPDYGISAHVLEQPRSRQYAARQIQRARDEAFQPELRTLNDRFTVIENEAGKCRVIEFLEEIVPRNKTPRRRITRQSFEDFRNRFMHLTVEVGKDKDKDGNALKMPLGKWWLLQQWRRQAVSIVFCPDQDEDMVDGNLNLWQGWPVKPAPGDWSLMKAHVETVLAGGDLVAAEYILKWGAWAVQHPELQTEVALVFRGGKGTGKGMFVRALKDMFGQHGIQVDGAGLITGRFNGHMQDPCLLYADEVEVAGGGDAEARLKRLVTEDTLAIEGKGRAVVQVPNMLHVVMTSNKEWVVPVPGNRCAPRHSGGFRRFPAVPRPIASLRPANRPPPSRFPMRSPRAPSP